MRFTARRERSHRAAGGVQWDANRIGRNCESDTYKGRIRAAKEEQPEAQKKSRQTPEEQKKRGWGMSQKKRREAAQARAEVRPKYLEATLAKIEKMGVELVPWSCRNSLRRDYSDVDGRSPRRRFDNLRGQAGTNC